MPLTTQEGFIAAGGGRLECRRIAPAVPGRPTLVFLHEGLGCVAGWRRFPALLAETTGCGVLVYTRAGYGGSSPIIPPRPLRYMHAEALEVLPQVLAHFDLWDAVLVGHSDGGSISLIYAGSPAAADGRVIGMVLLAPHVFNEEMCVAGIRRAGEAFDHGDLRARLMRQHGDNVDCAFEGWRRTWLSPEFMGWNIEEYLPPIRIPALVIQGRDDEYGSAAQYEAIAAQSGGPVELMILDCCGHAPHRDRPDTTASAIGRFVHSLSATAPVSFSASTT